MSFLRNNFLTGSLRRRSATAGNDQLHRDETNRNHHNKQAEYDGACFETYQNHWQQLDEAIIKHSATPGQTTHGEDSVLIVTSHLEHLVSLLVLELTKNKDASIGSSACLDHFLKFNILAKICSWGLEMQNDELLTVVATAIDSILAAAKKSGKDQTLLRDPSVHSPIRQMLSRYEFLKESGANVSPLFETILVSLSYYICVFIVREPSFLDMFYDIATTVNQPKFPMLTLLMYNLYKNGAQGQTSRDNLKLLMSLAKEQQLLAQFIALQSDFCPIVATGLSAVYSDLPRLLPKHVEEAGMLSGLDIESIKEVEMFVTSLEFCDSILETASWLIVGQLLDYCFSGFLVPVLGPALFQDSTGLSVKLLDSSDNVNTMKEILASTCYLTLCIRRIRNRGFVGIFVRFLLAHKHEGTPVIEFLVGRLASQSELRLATLNLFHALVGLNCEDVMLVLAMKYLLPCSHVMLSQRGNVLQEMDTNCLWAAKFLSLVPTACTSRTAQKKFNTNNADGDQRSLQENEPTSRIRSWSRNSNDSGDSRYGHLAFTSNERKSLFPEQISLKERVPSETLCLRLRNYLNDEMALIRPCVDHCRQWTYLYNGTHPPLADAIRMLQGHPSEGLHSSEQPVAAPTTSEETPEELDSPEKATTSIRLPITSEYSSVDPADVFSYCMAQLATCLSEIDTHSASSPGQSSGYQSFNFNAKLQDPLQEKGSFLSQDVQDDLEFWSLMRDEDDLECVPPTSPTVNERNVASRTVTDVYPPALPSIGPFLEVLFKSVDGWLNNTMEVNLALCSIISRLACYPHPLLRSLLLNPYLVLQPSVPSLVLSIATLKQRIDNALRVNDNAASLLEAARLELKNFLVQDSAKNVKPAGLPSTKAGGESKQRPSSKFAGLFSSFVRREATEVIKEETTSNHAIGNGNHSHRRPGGADPIDPIGSHVALCAVLLEEWLHELAALSIEHAVHFTPMTIPIAKV